MDFELSDDQRALQDAARALLDDEASSARVRELVADGGEPYDRKLWEALVDQGWLAVDVPEDAGGLGLGFVEVAILAEQIGRHNAPAPFVQSVLARSALADTGWAGPLADGSAIGAVGWAGSAGATRVLLAYGPVADVAVVLVGDEVHVADLSAAGRPPAEPAMDLTRCLGWLDLDAVPTRRLDRPAAGAASARPTSPSDAVVVGGEDDRGGGPDRVGGPSDAVVVGGEDDRRGGAEKVSGVGPAPADADVAARLLDRAATAYAAELLGGAGQVLDMATEYAKHRVQFGQPIGAFQAVKHRCADMLVDVEGMYSTAYYAAWCVSVDDPDRSVAASTAKVWCSDAARRVMASGLQVHGGVGFTWDHDLHLYLKRSQLDQVSFGDATVHRERLATLLRARLDAGDPVL